MSSSTLDHVETLAFHYLQIVIDYIIFIHNFVCANTPCLRLCDKIRPINPLPILCSNLYSTEKFLPTLQNTIFLTVLVRPLLVILLV